MRGSEYAELQAFMAIVEQGNFSRAAAHLSVSPSALSQIIRTLETRLGVRLLNRTTRSVGLTDAGRSLVLRLRPALNDLETAVAGLAHLRDVPSGTLRLQVPHLAMRLYLEPLLGDFLRQYSEVVLDITLDDAVSDLLSGGFDASFRLGEVLNPGLGAVKIGGDFRQVAVAAPAYLAEHGTPRVPRDLLRHRCINWRQSGSVQVYAWEFQEAGQVYSVSVPGPLTVSDRSVALAAALQGVGIAFWVEDQVRPWVQAGRLVPLLEEYAVPFPGFYLCYPDQQPLPLPLQALIEFLQARITGVHPVPAPTDSV